MKNPDRGKKLVSAAIVFALILGFSVPLLLLKRKEKKDIMWFTKKEPTKKYFPQQESYACR